MILDSRLEFADGEDISQSTGTYLATNQIDIETARDIGQARQMYLVIQIDVAVAGAHLHSLKRDGDAHPHFLNRGGWHAHLHPK